MTEDAARLTHAGELRTACVVNPRFGRQQRQVAHSMNHPLIVADVTQPNSASLIAQRKRRGWSEFKKA